MVSAGEAVEFEYRMQLDRIRRNTSLPVVEIEEGDPGNTCPRAKPDVAPCHHHLPAPHQRCVPVAAQRRRLRDHVIATLLEDKVQVAIRLRPDEHDRGDNRVDVPLEGKSRIGQVRRSRPRNEEVDRRRPRRQEPRPILERLHGPALNTAGGLEAGMASRSESRRDRCHYRGCA
jgi:hypothetical protein